MSIAHILSTNLILSDHLTKICRDDIYSDIMITIYVCLMSLIFQVTAIDKCPHLKIFATAGKDGYMKVGLRQVINNFLLPHAVAFIIQFLYSYHYYNQLNLLCNDV